MRRIMIGLSLLALQSVARAQEELYVFDGACCTEMLSRLSPLGDVDLDGTRDFVVHTHGGGGLMLIVSGATGQLIREIEPGIRNYTMGWSAWDAGDFNGDGVPDIVAGARSWSWNLPGMDGVGKVLVYSGLDASVLMEALGQVNSHRLGQYVTGVGDVDGNGSDDVLAASLHDVFLYGGPSGQILRTHHAPGAWPSIAALGDVNGDGRPDYAIGLPQDGFGSATIYSGVDGSVIHRIEGEPWDFLGVSVASAGDFDADGTPDMVVGAPGHLDPNFGSQTGRADVYSGADASLLLELADPNPESNFGDRVSGGWDINGDGVLDFAIGAPRDDGSTGAIWFYSGRTGMPLWKRVGSNTFARMGGQFDAVAILPDLTGDGLAEFAYGDATYGVGSSGVVKVFHGALGDADRYCTGAPNSAGPGARMELRTPISVGNNLLSLAASGAPPGRFGLFYYGSSALAGAPFGDGVRCVGGTLARVHPPGQVAPDGTLVQPVDLNASPFGAGPTAVTAGSTWHFQLWYRDLDGPGGGPGATGFNLSDALKILFTP